MPTPARKSSTGGNRRLPLKTHIPFRGDNPEVGKKTGIAVELVARRADGFEAFEDIIRQADKRTPPKVKGRKRKLVAPSPEADDDGEMSMDMDDSNPNSPMEFFTNARVLAAARNADRADSSSRVTTRSAALDFDRVPSPRPRNSLTASKRQSMANGSAPGPSSLSRSTIIPELESPPERLQGNQSGIMDDDDPQDSPIRNSSPRQTSFLQMDQDDDDDGNVEQDMDETPIQISKKRKGKERAKELEQDQQEDHEVEREIAQGLEDVELEPPSDTETDALPPNKKVKVANEKPRQKRERKVQQQQHSPTPAGIRRGKRLRYGPLEWWRQEKVVYGRRESGLTLVPHIKEIRRVPKESVIPLGSQKRKRGTTVAPRSKSRTVEEPIIFNPEEGWDDNTEQQGVVIDFVTKEEVQRRVAFTAKMVEPRAAANNDWFFQKVFGDGDFIAAGQLIIPPKGRKPSKGTKDNTYIFYVIEGAVNLRVHETSLILATGGMFMVPRGNTYFIENIAERDAKLFFTQARKIAAGEDEQVPHIHTGPRGPGSRRSSEALPRTPGAPRSSSAGATSVPSPTVRANGMRSTSTTKRSASTKI